MQDNTLKGRIIFSENYKITIESIKRINNYKTDKASVVSVLDDQELSEPGSKLYLLSDHKDIKPLRPKSFKEQFPNGYISAYDESILELNSLEGKVRCTTHCSVIQDEKEYNPSAYVTLKFYTKSNIIASKISDLSDIIRCDDIGKRMKVEYVEERMDFLSQAVPKNTLMFIDGSMFSGQYTSGNFVLIDFLEDNNCRPIFFVKNSESTIITERFDFAKGYHSDLHWAYDNLKTGEMSPVFAYISPDGRGKAMSFIKVFNKRSPIRVEFPLEFFKQGLYEEDVFNSIYYQYLANGSTSNVQPRIIQVAEMYAREILKSTNLYKEIERMGLTKSMNEERF